MAKLTKEADVPAHDPVQATPAVESKHKVTLLAVIPGFVDLITNQRFGEEPVEVEMHPWLQAQVNAGHLVVM